MSYWRANPSAIRFAFVILPLLCIGGAIWLWGLLSARSAQNRFDTGVFLLGLTLFVLMALVGLLAYIAWCQWNMGYRTEATQIVIRCGGVIHVVPFEAVKAVYGPGELFTAQPVTLVRRGMEGLMPLLGYYVGPAQSPQLGRVIMVATQPPERQVFVVTRDVAFGLSPEDAVGFMRSLEGKFDPDDLDELYPPARDVVVRTDLSGPSAWAAGLWADRPARVLLLVGLVLNVLLFLYLSFVYADLPQLLPLHWNAQAQVDRIGDPTELLRLPVFALAVWWINVVAGWLVLSRERAATLFLLAGGVAAQIVFAAGALSIVGRAI